jgi:hypothetical protein
MAVGVSLLAGALFYVRFGYGYGFSDQDEFIPLVMRWLDGQLFVHDWFVQQQSEAFGIRTFFAAVVYLPSLILPVGTTVLLLHAVTWAALSTALFRISFRLHHNELTALIFTIAATVVTARWAPGGNDIFHSMLVSSSAGWALALWSLERLLAQRFVFAGVLISVSMLMHPLVGLQVGTVLLAAILITERRHWMGFGLPFLAVAVPLIATFAGLGATQLAPDSDPSAILTTLRAPHHYLLAAFSPMSWLKWITVVILGGYALWTDRFSTSRGRARSSVLAVGILSLLVVLGAIVGSAPCFDQYAFQGHLIRLQPFNMAVFAKLAFLLGASALVTDIFPTGVRRSLRRIIRHRGFVVFMMVLFGAAVLLGRPIYTTRSLSSPGTSESSSMSAPDRVDPETTAWIRDNTPVDAVFVIPPGVSGFQIGSQRAQFVNFKAFPFTPDASVEWLDRLIRIAPITDLEPGGTPLQARLDAAFFSTDPEYWSKVLDEENIDYIVRPRNQGNPWPEDLAAHCSSQWCVFDSQAILNASNLVPL